MNAYRILLVDDDATFLARYGDFLRSRGFDVHTSASAEKALEFFAGGSFQLVVLNVVMPGTNGIELIESIRSINPAQDIVVLTASDSVTTGVRALRLGVYDYLVKPVEREELLLLIDRLQERTTLYDEHARLLDENINYAETHQIFSQGLRVMQSLDLETVCECLLETLAAVCGAQGATLWLGREDTPELSMHGYRGLIDPSRMPMAWSPLGSALGTELRQGMPVLVSRDLSTPSVMLEPAGGALVPLCRDGRLVGLVYLQDKLGGGFGRKDVTRCRIIGECAAIAIAHASRYRQVERVGLRDAGSSAYNMTYFVDYLGRELHKARRYGRSFSLVQISVDHMHALKQSLPAAVLKETLRQLLVAMTGVLRDVDVLARLTDAEMLLLLPETDFIGGLTFARAAREAIRTNEHLAEIDRECPISVSFGPAAFPRDGDDIDQLFAACRRRLEEAHRSLFRKLHLDDVDFWEAFDLLIGSAKHYQGAEVTDHKALRVAEDARGISRHAIYPNDFGGAVRVAILEEAIRGARSSGWLFLGGRWDKEAESDLNALFRELGRLDASALRTYVLGSRQSDSFINSQHLTSVRVAGKVFDEHELVLLLAEHAAYGLLGRWREDGRLYGFHTADWTLIEGLIDKVQGAYHLQKGIT